MLTEHHEVDINLMTEGGVTTSSEQVGEVTHPSLIIEVCYCLLALLPSLSPDEPHHVGTGVYVEFATHCLLGLRIMRVFMATVYISDIDTPTGMLIAHMSPTPHPYICTICLITWYQCVYNGSSFQTPDTSPPPTVAPLDPGCVSIMGLPPFKWVQEKVVLECEQPLDQAWVM